MKWLLVAVVALAGCAGQAEPEPRTVRVEVPVAVPCRVPAVEVPAWAAAGLKKSDDLQTKVRALLAERRQRIGYEAQLLAALDAGVPDGCVRVAAAHPATVALGGLFGTIAVERA